MGERNCRTCKDFGKCNLNDTMYVCWMGNGYRGWESKEENPCGEIVLEEKHESIIKPPIEDKINHPSHYADGKVECIDAMEVVLKDLTGMEALCTGNVLKYIWRWKKKNGIEDLRKAKWYLERLIKLLEGGD